MAETNEIETATDSFDAPPGPAANPPATRGLGFYARGSWLFFKKMWPALWDLTSTGTYVNASAIAFNVILSFFSFIVLIGSFLINVLQWQRGYRTSFRLLMSLAPEKSAALFNSLDQVAHGPGGKATLFSFALLILSASGVFQPLEVALNRAWGFNDRGFIKQYLTYLLMVVICAAITLCAVALASVYDFALDKALGNSVWRTYIFNVIGPLTALPFIALLFFIIYYFVPNGRVQANQVMFTSIAIAALWLFATFVFWLALPLLDFEESYQQLASLMALVTWVFVSSFILILGANLSARRVLPESWTGFLPFRRAAPPRAGV